MISTRCVDMSCAIYIIFLYLLKITNLTPPLFFLAKRTLYIYQKKKIIFYFSCLFDILVEECSGFQLVWYHNLIVATRMKQVAAHKRKGSNNIL